MPLVDLIVLLSKEASSGSMSVFASVFCFGVMDVQERVCFQQILDEYRVKVAIRRVFGVVLRVISFFMFICGTPVASDSSGQYSPEKQRAKQPENLLIQYS